MLRIERVTLTDFRNYAALAWAPGARMVVLAGPNGSGKTNLLEALSLLGPGRGLRGARAPELARIGGGGGWAVAARLGDGTRIGTGEDGTRRRTLLDGEEVRSQAEIAARYACVWLTPAMDHLFEESAGGRRRFLDRLVWALHAHHAREAAAHETALASRNRLLAAPGGADPAWLAAVEDSIARHAVALAATRREVVARLNEAAFPGGFPRALLALADPIAARLGEMPALAVEDAVRAELRAARGADAKAGRSSVGAHRADFVIADAASGLAAARASTGQRKALLIGIILAHAALLAEARGRAPVLLLDEPLTHLDDTRRAALFATLGACDAQVFLTGTDAASFAALGSARVWQVHAGALAG